MLASGCADWFGMLMHPMMMDQRGYPCEQDHPPQDTSLMDLERPSIMLAGPCPSKGDTGYYSSFLDLFFATYLMREVFNASGIMAPDTVLGFP